MTGPELKKPIAPEGQELSDAISLVLKDHAGPVDVASVAEKLKAEHPTWKLPDRRVKKFVKKYEIEHKTLEGEEVPTEKRSKLFSSPSKSLRRLFSPKSKKKVPDELDTDSDAQPIPEDAPSVEEEPVQEVDAPEDEKAEDAADKEIAYKTEIESVDSSNDCFAPCIIM